MTLDQRSWRKYQRWMKALSNVAHACRAVEDARGSDREAMAIAGAGAACKALDRLRPPMEWLMGIDHPHAPRLVTKRLQCHS